MMSMSVVELPLDQIHANPQDRKSFDEAALRELGASIAAHGLAQPITVRPDEPGFVIVAGERRWRAHQLIGAKTIRAIVRSDLTDEAASAVQLIENVQRVDLDPLEEARAYQNRMTGFGMSIEKVAEWAGKPVGLVKRRLELLGLNDEFLDLIRSGDLPTSHAQTMTRLDGNRQRIAWRAFVKSNGQMTLWQFQKLVDELYAEQQQDGLFDDALYDVADLIERSRKNAVIAGRDLVRLTVDIGDALKEILGRVNDVAGLSLDELGVDAERVRTLMDQAETAKVTRATALKAGPSARRGKKGSK